MTPSKLELLDMLGDEQLRVLAIRRQRDKLAADRDRWRRACLAACRRLADAEAWITSDIGPGRIAKLGNSGFALRHRAFLKYR